jgi:tetratricopeptide (TPR) repeat protein
MSFQPPYPADVERPEEARIRQALELVQREGRSRVLLLYGSGGVGKTSLVRRMFEANSDPATTWLEPIDVDDPRYWLLANLENKIADDLDLHGTYFGVYRDEFSQLPGQGDEHTSRETVVSYLGRVKETFAQCYAKYVEEERKTVVIVFDTVETIRDTNFVSTLTQWIKALPKSTLFILAGRAADSAEAGAAQKPDPIVEGLYSDRERIPITEVNIEGFGQHASRDYVSGSTLSDDLAEDEKDKLILLTRGQPIWLALLLDYLVGDGIPREAEENSLEYIATHLPYDGVMTSAGEKLHESFLRSLVAPYRKSDFWHEATKRLAVVRQPIDRPVWSRLMADLELPPGTANLDTAWEELTRLPWIRPRANGRFVTLHDAVAEAFAQRLFPLHDRDEQWRLRIWRLAFEIYTELAAAKEAELSPLQQALDEDFSRGASGRDGEIIRRSLEVDGLRRELDELKAVGLYYLFLTDFEEGCKRLLAYFSKANEDHDLFIMDLLGLHLQRFLPGGASAGAFDDVIKDKLDEFRDWLRNTRPDYYVKIGIVVAAYLMEVAQPEAALELLDQLPSDDTTPPDGRYRIRILRGNATMRIPGRVRDARAHFGEALEVARAMPPAKRGRFVAEAHKEHGFYYRNVGDWDRADLSYKQARDTLVAASLDEPNAFGQEIASIQTNWAYVKGLAGSFSEGTHLAEAAVTVRSRSGDAVAEGISWSVCGEVYRYARRFEKAWAAYQAAERLLEVRPNWGWLGIIYQEQAICLHQALQDGVELVDDPTAEAKRLITHAIEICLTQSIRGYPSALNRAGRIFGQDNADEGLRYLDTGITQARRLADSWFLLSNLIEYVELCYRSWKVTGDDQYRAKITGRASEIDAAAQDFTFPGLIGRWTILQGHLRISDYLSNGDEDALADALENYRNGFPAIANRPVASAGVTMIQGEFENFERFFWQLRRPVRADWQTKLTAAWRDSGQGSTLLLARLQELLAPLREQI